MQTAMGQLMTNKLDPQHKQHNLAGEGILQELPKLPPPYNNRGGTTTLLRSSKGVPRLLLRGGKRQDLSPTCKVSPPGGEIYHSQVGHYQGHSNIRVKERAMPDSLSRPTPAGAISEPDHPQYLPGLAARSPGCVIKYPESRAAHPSTGGITGR